MGRYTHITVLQKNSEKLIYQQLKSGIRADEIMRRFNIGNPRFNAIFSMYMIKVNKENGICLGHKSIPYYDCEDDYVKMPTYNYSELSKTETDFYEGIVNTKKK